MKKRAKALITLFLSICIFNSCASERDPVIAQGLKDLIAFMIEGIDFPVDQRQILFLRQDTPIWRFGDVSQAVLECLQKEFESKNVYIFMWSESTEDEFGSVISKADSTYGILISVRKFIEHNDDRVSLILGIQGSKYSYAEYELSMERTGNGAWITREIRLTLIT